jgi:DNA processing protein
LEFFGKVKIILDIKLKILGLNMQSDLKFWNAINLAGEIGPVKFKKLIDFFPDMEKTWQATSLELKQAGFPEKDIANFLSKRKEINPDLEFEKILKEKVTLITIKDKNYPKLLAEIYNPPALLYIKGQLDTECGKPKIGVVGTRKMSPYGKQITQEITYDLAKSGMIIISGLALGVDAQAHEAALAAEQLTYAVLGSGVNSENIYPRNNLFLANKILEQGGALISEYPHGTPGLPQNFPQRNRIVVGLASGILVTECPENSGAMITARLALEQNREVFACPGSIYFENSKGTNRLIQQGAKLVTKALDIIEELNLDLILPKKHQIKPENEEEKKILEVLSKEPISLDLIVQKTNLPASKLLASLTKMELSSKVKNIGGMNYIKCL